MPYDSLNFELKYGTERHSVLLDAIMARYELGARERAENHEKWREAENLHQAYLPETENDTIRRSARKSGGIPQYTTLEIPYSYAIMLSAHTYWTSVFLGRNPVLQYTARHGEPEMSTQAVEALMDYQVQVGRMLAPFYIWMHDAGKYGIGVLWNYWDEETVTVSKIVEVPQTYLGLPIPGTSRKVKQTAEVPGYVGNKVFNIRPYDFVWDPRVPLSQLQMGEFVGRETEVPWVEIVKRQKRDEYFNIKPFEEILKASHEGKKTKEEGSEQLNWPVEDSVDGVGSFDIKDVGYAPLLEMYIELIPKDWKLGTGTSPEVWMFTIGNEEVIISARPYGAYHGKFPCFVLPYEIEGHQTYPRGMHEVLKPLSDTLSWLVNTHFYNVRSSLNNQFIFDPSRVVTKDLTSPGPGKYIRLKESAYGTDVRSAITQLPVADITQGHLRDAQLVQDMIQRVSGVTDNIMGMVNAGGRKTATEIRTSSTFGVNRLKTTAEWWSAGDWGLMAQVMLQNTQQYYDLDRQFKIAGDLMDWNRGPFMQVTPESIQGFFDFVPVDGTMPVDRFAQANLWREILMGMGKIPALAEGYDVAGIFAWMAQLAGLKNIKQFRINVVPDGQLAQQAQQGSVVPIKQGAADLANVSEPGQISGLGTTG